MVPANLCTLNYPIETEIQKKFWGSRHKCNRMKAIIAFSLNLANANDNLRRYGYSLLWRKKALRAFGGSVNNYQFTGMNFSEISTPWWECMPVGNNPPVVDKILKIWDDNELWGDDLIWEEFLETLPEDVKKEWIDSDLWGEKDRWEEMVSSSS